MTQEQIKRIKQSINETRDILKKEMSYSEDLQDQKRVKAYSDHLIKLWAMLK